MTPKVVVRSFRLPERLVDAMARVAHEEGITSTEIVRRAVTDYVGGESALLPPKGGERPVERHTARHSGIKYDRTSADRYMAYIPTSVKPGSNSEYRGRVTHIGTIERMAGKWLWSLKDDTGAGFEDTLAKAMEALEAHA